MSQDGLVPQHCLCCCLHLVLKKLSLRAEVLCTRTPLTLVFLSEIARKHQLQRSVSDLHVCRRRKGSKAMGRGWCRRKGHSRFHGPAGSLRNPRHLHELQTRTETTTIDLQLVHMDLSPAHLHRPRPVIDIIKSSEKTITRARRYCQSVYLHRACGTHC